MNPRSREQSHKRSRPTDDVIDWPGYVSPPAEAQSRTSELSILPRSNYYHGIATPFHNHLPPMTALSQSRHSSYHRREGIQLHHHTWAPAAEASREEAPARHNVRGPFEATESTQHRHSTGQIFIPPRMPRKEQSAYISRYEEQRRHSSNEFGSAFSPTRSLRHSSTDQSSPSGRTQYAQHVRSTSNTSGASRYSLFIRQQPRAARAGPDGRDRRAIDPPPVLQLMIDEFNPRSERDLAEMKSQSWVVHARLVTAHSPREDLSTLVGRVERQDQDGVTRLLLGTQVSSPFFCADDPDIDSMPQHPSTRAASPTSRIIPISRRERREDGHGDLPGTFFIFADLSVRKAGEYRLEFRLMKMSPSSLSTGSVVPVIATAVSSVFRVVNAKDFDQVQPSTRLVKGLLERGAGFPLKLKKGIREGQRRRKRHPSSSDEDDNDYNDYYH